MATPLKTAFDDPRAPCALVHCVSAPLPDGRPLLQALLDNDHDALAGVGVHMSNGGEYFRVLLTSPEYQAWRNAPSRSMWREASLSLELPCNPHEHFMGGVSHSVRVLPVPGRITDNYAAQIRKSANGAERAPVARRARDMPSQSHMEHVRDLLDSGDEAPDSLVSCFAARVPFSAPGAGTLLDAVAAGDWRRLADIGVLDGGGELLICNAHPGYRNWRHGPKPKEWRQASQDRGHPSQTFQKWVDGRNCRVRPVRIPALAGRELL